MAAYFIRSVLVSECVCLCVWGALFRITLSCHDSVILNSEPHTHTHTNTDLIKYEATPQNQPRRYILTDYFNNSYFSKAQIIRSLMMVIKPEHVGTVLKAQDRDR